MHLEVKDSQAVDPNIAITTRYSRHRGRINRFVPITDQLQHNKTCSIKFTPRHLRTMHHLFYGSPGKSYNQPNDRARNFDSIAPLKQHTLAAELTNTHRRKLKHF